MVRPHSVEALELLAAQAGAALGNAHRYRERGQYEERLSRQALHDALTGLPNRLLLRDRLSRALAASARSGAPLAVMLLDLDRFKEINDTLGHGYGDGLLVQVAQRLSATVRGADSAARLGGDEFALLAVDVADAQDARHVAKRVLAALHEPYVVDGLTLDVEASIGIALAPRHGTDVDALLRCADVAMYAAKTARLGISVYDPTQDEHTPDRLALLGDLRRALDVDDQLVLHYQPQVDVALGELVGVEALARWRHPSRGLIPPVEFIPVAEGTGLIHKLTTYVLGRALAQARIWADAGHPLPVAVNVSTRCLLDVGLPDQIDALLARHGVPPHLLRLEINEGTIMSDPTRALAVLQRLSDRGIRLSVDDFGTGYSSMSYLKRLPIDELKVDRSFVLDMGSQASDAVLVRSVVEIGHNLGLAVVAEGGRRDARRPRRGRLRRRAGIPPGSADARRRPVGLARRPHPGADPG
ncbi:MAG TPA: EAL domain-containing protein [Mycobacteriales bacterium]|nr:EAL domain-containing protein [Mycobacteriales bacterium]